MDQQSSQAFLLAARGSLSDDQQIDEKSHTYTCKHANTKPIIIKNIKYIIGFELDKMKCFGDEEKYAVLLKFRCWKMCVCVFDPYQDDFAFRTPNCSPIPPSPNYLHSLTP